MIKLFVSRRPFFQPTLLAAFPFNPTNDPFSDWSSDRRFKLLTSAKLPMEKSMLPMFYSLPSCIPGSKLLGSMVPVDIYIGCQSLNIAEVPLNHEIEFNGRIFDSRRLKLSLVS
jgi:hypothetical protein